MTDAKRAEQIARDTILNQLSDDENAKVSTAEAAAIELEQDRTTLPAEPVETDSNDEPAADANGDSDDEREDENQAVPDPIA